MTTPASYWIDNMTRVARASTGNRQTFYFYGVFKTRLDRFTHSSWCPSVEQILHRIRPAWQIRLIRKCWWLLSSCKEWVHWRNNAVSRTHIWTAEMKQVKFWDHRNYERYLSSLKICWSLLPWKFCVHNWYCYWRPIVAYSGFRWY